MKNLTAVFLTVVANCTVGVQGTFELAVRALFLVVIVLCILHE